MTGKEFIRRLTRLGRKRGVAVVIVASRGKGDHSMLCFGDCRTILGGLGEIKKGTLHGMLRQLGLTLNDFR